MSDNADYVFDEFLKKIAKELFEEEVINLGKILGVTAAAITLLNLENANKGNHMGTLKMLQQWRRGQTKAPPKKELKAALEKANLKRLVDDEYLSADDDVGQDTKHTAAASAVQGASSQYQESWIPQVSGNAENSPAQLQSHATETSESPSIFISYQWDKQAVIKRLLSRLTALGYHCWFDDKDMGGGDELNAEIAKGLRNAKVVISCVTPTYALSKMCRKEVSLSNDLKKPIIPLLLEKMKWPPEGPMGMFFTGILYIDCTKESTQAKFKDEKFDKLIKKIDELTKAEGASSS